MQIETQELLDRLGYPIFQRGDTCLTSTIYRGGDNPQGLYINPDGSCYDLVQSRAFNVVEFVMRVLDCNFKAAEAFIKSSESADEVEKKEIIKVPKKFDPSDIQNLTPSYKFYLDRGIRRSVLEEFGCGLAHSGRFYGRIVFPITSRKATIGAAGRDVMGREIAKWKICGQKKLFVYPKASLPYVIQTRKVILVESIGDCLSLWNAEIKNVLVTFGTALSDELLKTIVGHNPKKIFIALNNDLGKEKNAGQEGAKKIRKKLETFFSKESIIDAPPESGDFGDGTVEENRRWAQKYQTN